jgi:hypothetical protein
MSPTTQPVGRLGLWGGESGGYFGQTQTPLLSAKPDDGPEGWYDSLIHREADVTAETTLVTGQFAWHVFRFSGQRVPLESTSSYHGIEWLPWTFRSYDTEVNVSFNRVGLVSGGADAYGPLTDDMTELMPMPSTYQLINVGHPDLPITSLRDENLIVTLLVPGLVPRQLRIKQESELFRNIGGMSPNASSAIGAIRELGKWLNVSQDEVSEVCRFSVRAAQYWSQGTTPRPITVRRLFEVHALVRALHKSMGRRATLEWLQTPDVNGISRLEVLAQRDGPAEVARAAGSFLFVEPLREQPYIEGLEDVAGPDEDGVDSPAIDFRGHVGRAKVTQLSPSAT